MHLGPLITYAVLRTTGKWKGQKRLPIIMRLENSVLCLVFNLIAMNTIMLTALTKIHQTSNWHQCVYIQQLLEGMLRLKLLQCVHKSWFRCCRVSSECRSIWNTPQVPLPSDQSARNRDINVVLSGIASTKGSYSLTGTSCNLASARPYRWDPHQRVKPRTAASFWVRSNGRVAAFLRVGARRPPATSPAGTPRCVAADGGNFRFWF